ncbi:hypothetical protein AADZ86_09090 [Colwelliaceae bacterium BS250]
MRIRTLLLTQIVITAYREAGSTGTNKAAKATFFIQLGGIKITSNPSSAYIERVANKFAEKGDLTATIKAVLLDKETRNPQVYDSISFGKIKELIIQLTASLRLFNAKSRIALDDTADTSSKP